MDVVLEPASLTCFEYLGDPANPTRAIKTTAMPRSEYFIYQSEAEWDRFASGLGALHTE